MKRLTIELLDHEIIQEGDLWENKGSSGNCTNSIEYSVLEYKSKGSQYETMKFFRPIKPIFDEPFKFLS